jgi:hypothetical protein
MTRKGKSVHPRLSVSGLTQPVTVVQHAFFDQQCLRNSGVAACLMSLGFRLYYKRGILVSVCGDLLDVFLKKRVWSGCRYRDIAGCDDSH